MKHFFSLPLENLAATSDSVMWGARTLPDPQLAAEIDALRTICAGDNANLAAKLVLRLYEGELARRNDPKMAFDDRLDAALERLVRQTTPEDRYLVRSIGERIFALGGDVALQEARRRMLSMQREDKRDLRASILDRRWSGITS